MKASNWISKVVVEQRNSVRMSDDRAERSDGKIVKMEIDYSATVDQRLPECDKMAKVS